MTDYGRCRGSNRSAKGRNQFTRYCFRLILVGLVWSWAGDGLNADWIWRHGQSQPISGIVLERSSDRILFAPHAPDPTISSASDSLAMESIASTDVARVVITIDQERLTQLGPTNPMEYLEMGDELALAPDPAAKYLAIRLYVLAAAHTQGSTRIRAVRSILPLARNVEEKDRCQLLLAMWGDTTVDAEALPQQSARQPREGTLGQGTLDDLRELLELLRRENFEAARIEMATKPQLQERVNEFAPQFSWSKLQQWSAQSSLLTIDLYQILSWQRAIEIRAGDSKRAEFDDDWSHAAKQPWRPRALVPRLETLTEFDPRATQFRDGQWVSHKTK